MSQVAQKMRGASLIFLQRMMAMKVKDLKEKRMRKEAVKMLSKISVLLQRLTKPQASRLKVRLEA
jgi:hypothetical protein